MGDDIEDDKADIGTTADKPSVLRETDEDARRLARILVRSARYMALAVLEPETGFPSASRVLTGTDVDGVPVILVSGLSAHTKALSADPRCSLLAGEVGKGDPLAHPRITLQCMAKPVIRDTPEHERIRGRFLDRHPKAALYADFADFRFFRITPHAASLNGGFGRAYIMPGADLVIREPGITSEWLELPQKLQNMTEAANFLAARSGSKNTKNWQFNGADRAGIDLISGNLQLRHEFEQPIRTPDGVLDYIFVIANVQ